MSEAKNLEVNRAWSTDLPNEEFGIFSHKDSLNVAFFKDNTEHQEAFLTKAQVRELHQELGKWLAGQS